MHRLLSVLVTAILMTASAATASAEIVSIDGTVKSVDAKKRTITVTTSTREMTLDVGSKAKINVDGKESELKELTEGQKVILSFHDQLEVIVKIDVVEAASDSETEISLFDGKTLNGWHGNDAVWKVKDGAIVGKNVAKLKSNTFLVSDRTFDDFVLRLKFRLIEGNSGVQLRSTEPQKWLVRGPQADIAELKFLGCLTNELGQPPIIARTTEEQRDELKQVMKPASWNDMTIVAEGQSVLITINGFTTVNVISEHVPKSGVIALQVHGGGRTHVEFKDIVISPIP